MYLFLSVLLNYVPELPYKFWMQNIKWLVWIFPPMLYIRCKQVVIWLLIPLVGDIKAIGIFLNYLIHTQSATGELQRHKMAR